MSSQYDYIVVGAGSAGCAVAHGLAQRGAGKVLVLEAGVSNKHPLVSFPFGLVWLMGSKARDWNLQSAPQRALNQRQVTIPRGKMLGGSSSINSMVYFHGRRDDFDNWQVVGWDADRVWQAYGEVDAIMAPELLPDPHPLSQNLASGLAGAAGDLSPERVSAGVFKVNMHNGRRFSAADGFLQPAMQSGQVSVKTNAQVDCLLFSGDKATGVRLIDGNEISAAKGVVLSAGAIASPEILLRSGIGPQQDLAAVDIDCRLDVAEVGQNLHDHPAINLHHAGANTGYGLTLNQAWQWLTAPAKYLLTGKGPMASNCVEAGAFMNALDPTGKPDVQVHFIPFMIGWQDKAIVTGSGYYADVCVSRPKSRGQLRLVAKDPRAMANIDFGLLTDQQDMDTLVAGFKSLRHLLQEADFGERRAPEVYPAQQAANDELIQQHIRQRAGTSYHPVGTIRMGDDKAAPIDGKLKFRGLDNLWVADASIMPSITSANTNVPCMMIGHRAAQFIAGC